MFPSLTLIIATDANPIKYLGTSTSISEELSDSVKSSPTVRVVVSLWDDGIPLLTGMHHAWHLARLVVRNMKNVWFLAVNNSACDMKVTDVLTFSGSACIVS
jgi:hypothetical protein